MIDLKNAYQVFGVKEDASRQQIERVYQVFFKKYQAAKKVNEVNEIETEYTVQTEAGKMSFEEINQAYDLLMGYQTEEDLKETLIKPSPMLDKLGIDKKKAGNFFYYHKYHIIVTTLFSILIILIAKDIITKSPIDLEIACVGNIYVMQDGTAKNIIKSDIEGIRGVHIETSIPRSNMGGQVEYGMAMKRMAISAINNTDIFLLDQENFEFELEHGILVSLDEIVEQFNVDEAQKVLGVYEKEGQKEEHIYGIDVSQSEYLKTCNIYGEKMIVAMGVKRKHEHNALELMKLLLK